MALPGISVEKDLKLELGKLFDKPDLVYKFALAASGPRDGALMLQKIEKFKKQAVESAAGDDAKEQSGGKPVKLDVMVGECRRDSAASKTLRLIVYGKAPAKAVSCFEHLLVKGPYKNVGFEGVILEEIDENGPPQPAATTAPTETKTPPSSPTSDSPAPTSDDPSAAWVQALSAIEPKYLEVVSQRPDMANKLRAVMAFAQGKAEAEAYGDALVGLQKLAELLSGIAPPTTSSKGPTPERDPAADWAKALAAIQPAYERGLAGNPERAAQLKAVMEFAQGKAAAGLHAAGIAGLKKLAELLKGGAAPTSPPSGPREKLLPIWTAAKDEADEAIGKLQVKLRELDDDDLNTIVEFGLHGVTTGQSVQLMAALRDADSAGSPEALNALLEAVQDYRDFLDGAPIVDLLEENEFGVAVPLRKTLGAALDQLEKLAAV